MTEQSNTMSDFEIIEELDDLYIMESLTKWEMGFVESILDDSSKSLTVSQRDKAIEILKEHSSE